MREQASVDVDRIDGTPRTIRDLFTARRYDVDYYQREYAWSPANVSELLDDLSSRFLDSWDSSHAHEEVAAYRPYFLGPIVTNRRGGTVFVVDGQQRLTTLTLLLIYFRHLQAGRPEREQVDVKPFIASTKFGKYSFNLDIDDRLSVMQALMDGAVPTIDASDESAANLWARYQDIEKLFAQELKGQALPYFIDWLLERVAVVEIATPDQEMALEIFETMNDRGLRLTTTDMLKSYLLSMIRDRSEIETSNQLWRGRIADLASTEDKGDSDFIRNWLRSKYAETIRERRKDAVPGDFDIIATAPHKWARDHHEDMGLRRPADFASLIQRDFDRLSARYLKLLQVAQTPTPGFEEVYYNAWNGFTFQYPLLLATLSPVDDDETFQLKARMVAGWADIFVARRMVNYRNFGYSTVSYTMFNLMKRIRDLDVVELGDVLGATLAEETDSFDAVMGLSLHQRNGNHIRYILARITAWLEAQCGGALSFADLVSRERKHPFEIEHIWANHPEDHPEFVSEQAFSDQRNKFGGLLLLPKDFNAAYGDDPYAKKVEHYLEQNWLARSLNRLAYERNPAFLRLRSELNLPFEPIEVFTVRSFEERQRLYQRLCEVIWDPSNYGLDVPGKIRTEESEEPRRYSVSLGDLVSAGLIQPGQTLEGFRGGVRFTSTVTPEGNVELPDGRVWGSPSAAGAKALGAQACNGWDFWQTRTASGLVKLSRVRDEYLERHRRPAEEKSA